MLYFLYKLSDSDVSGGVAYGQQARRRQDHQYQQRQRQRQYQHRQLEERHGHRNLTHRPGTSASSTGGALNSPSSSDGYRLDGGDARSAASPTVASSRAAAGRLTAAAAATTTTTTSRMGKAKMGREFVVDSATFNDAFSEAEPGALASADAASAGGGGGGSVAGMRVRSPMTGQRPMSSASAWSARSGLGGAGIGMSSRDSQQRREGRSAHVDRRIPRSHPGMEDDGGLSVARYDAEDGAESVRREIRSTKYKSTRTTQRQYRSRRRVNGAGSRMGTETETGTGTDSDFDSELTADDDGRSRQSRNQRHSRPQHGGEGDNRGGGGDDDDYAYYGQLRIMRPSEPTLLRGLPNMLQGLPTEHVSFVQEKTDSEGSKSGGGGSSSSNSTTQICLPSTLSAPTISILHHLAEPALLYRELDAFTEGSSSTSSSATATRPGSMKGSVLGGDSSFYARKKDHHHHHHRRHHRTHGDGHGNADDADDDGGGGLVGQGLRAAIGVELRKYLDLVADLEKKIRGALLEAGSGAGDESDGGNEDGLGGYDHGGGGGGGGDDDDKRIRRVRKAQREQVGRIAAAGVTLKKCVVLMRDATMRLRLMSAIVHACQGA